MEILNFKKIKSFQHFFFVVDIIINQNNNILFVKN